MACDRDFARNARGHWPERASVQAFRPRWAKEFSGVVQISWPGLEDQWNAQLTGNQTWRIMPNISVVLLPAWIVRRFL